MAFPFFSSPFRAMLGGVKKGSTVGRRSDLPWVVSTTYSRFFRRPTVGCFLGVQKGSVSLGRKGGCRKTRRKESEGTWKAVDSLWGEGADSTVGVKNFSPFVSA